MSSARRSSSYVYPLQFLRFKNSFGPFMIKLIILKKNQNTANLPNLFWFISNLYNRHLPKPHLLYKKKQYRAWIVWEISCVAIQIEQISWGCRKKYWPTQNTFILGCANIKCSELCYTWQFCGISVLISDLSKRLCEHESYESRGFQTSSPLSKWLPNVYNLHGVWSPVPWPCEDKKQMLYPLDHDAPPF